MENNKITNEKFQLQLQAEMQQRQTRNSTRVELERLLSRPQQLPIFAEGFRTIQLPLKETRIGFGEVEFESRRESDDSPTGSINLISFSDDADLGPTRRRSIQTDNTGYSTTDGEKLRKTILELKRVFSRRSTAEYTPNGFRPEFVLPNPFPSSGNDVPSSTGRFGVRNRHQLLRRNSNESRRDPIEVQTISTGDTQIIGSNSENPNNLDLTAITFQSLVSNPQNPASNSLSNLPDSTPISFSNSQDLASSSLSNSQDASNDDDSNGDYGESRETLKVSEKVVWISGRNHAESGTVMWVGDVGGGSTAGVEFENAVGNTDGMFKGIRYFQCGPKHGGFLPLTSLIKYSDYYCANGGGNFKSSIDNSGKKTDGECLSSEPSRFPDGGVSESSHWGLSDEEDNVIICAICQDPLLMAINFSEFIHSSSSDVGMVSTVCGHLFHDFCLNKWFHMKPALSKQECPYCKKMMDITSTIRIFPVLGKP